MPSFFIMIENWSETTYIFPLDDKNYLPIYVFNVDMTSKELEKAYPGNSEYPRFAGESGTSFGASYFAANNSLIDFYNTIYAGSLTGDSTDSYRYGFFKPVENEFFTIKHDPHYSYHYRLSLTNNGTEILPGQGGIDVIGATDKNTFSFTQVYLTCIKTSDDVYYGNTSMLFTSSGYWSTSIGSISVPTADSKGFLTNTNYNYGGWGNGVCLFIYPGVNASKYVGNHIRKIIGKSKKHNPDDPYKNVGDDPDDPPDGDFDYNSDDVTIPDLPQTSVTDSGLVTLFAPNNEQLKSLAKYLWSDAFSLDSFKKLFNNPMDCILGLSILPIHLPHGSAKEITVGNIISTVSCDVCSRQYVKLNCGTFTMSRSAFTGGYLDYSPYTKAYLYLPFIGSQQIDIDEFMNTTIGVEYHIDILTGAMFCYVTRNNKLLLTYSGNCAENVPLSANDFTSTISSMISIATVGAGAVATIATAGAAAPALAGAGEAALGARTASSLIGAGAAGAGAVMNSKPSVQHSGSLGGGAGAMGCLYPYILFVAPRISLPGNQNEYTGFPSNKIVKIGSLSGFNVIEAVNLSVKGATDAEVSEIEAVLRNGVII